MFRSLITKISAWVETVDILGSDLAETVEPHPHRRPVRVQPQRRAGSVAARPAVCISPVRPAHDRQRQRATQA